MDKIQTLQVIPTMTKPEALNILTHMQLWRRGLPPYDDTPCEMPHSPNKWGEAVDIAIEALLQSIENEQP